MTLHSHNKSLKLIIVQIKDETSQITLFCTFNVAFLSKSNCTAAELQLKTA